MTDGTQDKTKVPYWVVWASGVNLGLLVGGVLSEFCGEPRGLWFVPLLGLGSAVPLVAIALRR